MREALFVKQNSARWKQYEIEPTHDPDELAERFIAITDDLAYAKTFYPQSKTTAYLNTLAGGFHQDIYKNKKEKANRFVKFWRLELPLLFGKYRVQLFCSFLFFTAFFWVGVISARYDTGFIRFIMGDTYINMTEANIAKGDPFGVYKQGNSYLMFYKIASNNLGAMVQAFVMGIFFAIGTIYALFKNGIMLGAFEYFFFSRGFGLKSILVIWIHGTLEISCIIISGGAGLALGGGILFPQTYKRIISFKNAAKDGMKIALGITPIIVLAAIFESFVTRHTEMPVWASLLILSGSFVFIAWYVVIYPYYLTRTLTSDDAAER